MLIADVTDTTWQSVWHGLCSTEPEDEGCITRMVHDCNVYVLYIVRVGCMCTCSHC